MNPNSKKFASNEDYSHWNEEASIVREREERNSHDSHDEWYNDDYLG
jgi:hypothetical protein